MNVEVTLGQCLQHAGTVTHGKTEEERDRSVRLRKHGSWMIRTTKTKSRPDECAMFGSRLPDGPHEAGIRGRMSAKVERRRAIPRHGFWPGHRSSSRGMREWLLTMVTAPHLSPSGRHHSLDFGGGIRVIIPGWLGHDTMMRVAGNSSCMRSRPIPRFCSCVLLRSTVV